MGSRLADITKFNVMHFTLEGRLRTLLNTKTENKAAKALELLNETSHKKLLNFEITSLSNQIFLREGNWKECEEYKTFLKNSGLRYSYFEIPRLLENDQYEQAVLLAMKEFNTLIHNNTTSAPLVPYKTANTLSMFTLLKEACARDDTIIITELIDIFEKYDMLTDANYAHLLSAAFANKNELVLARLFDYFQTVELTDNTWKLYADVFINQQNDEKVLEIITKITSNKVKNEVCLNLLASHDFNECMILMDELVADGTLIPPTFNELPSNLISIPDLDQFTIIEEKLSVLDEIKTDSVKGIVISSLLASIDNTDKFISSTIFLLNGLGFKRNLLNDKHKDIIFHQLSKYSLKLTSLKFVEYFKKMGLLMTVDNYLRILKCQLSGTEIDTFFYLLVKIMEQFNVLPQEIAKLVKLTKITTKDNRCWLFTPSKNKTENTEYLNITAIKEELNYEFLKKNLEFERERTKPQIKLKNRLAYDYALDIKHHDSLNL